MAVVAMRLCVGDHVVPTVDVDDIDFVRVGGTSASALEYKWWSAALGIKKNAARGGGLAKLRGLPLVKELLASIEDARGPRSKVAKKMNKQSRTAGAPSLDVVIRGMTVRVVNSTTSVLIQATVSNISWLLDCLKADLASAAAMGDSSDSAATDSPTKAHGSGDQGAGAGCEPESESQPEQPESESQPEQSSKQPRHNLWDEDARAAAASEASGTSVFWATSSNAFVARHGGVRKWFVVRRKHVVADGSAASEIREQLTRALHYHKTGELLVDENLA